jgi:regulator of protease activity HflC (stomatin/prohibitin superfamily)
MYFIFVLIATIFFLIFLKFSLIKDLKRFPAEEKSFNILWSLVSIFVILWGTLIFSSFSKVSPGEVGVIVNLFGSKKGVEEKELLVGYHFIKPWESLYKFPIFEQNHQWINEESFSFQTSEGLTIKAGIGINFNLVPTKIHELFCKYRKGMDEITHLFIRNNIRDAINRASSRMKVEDLIGPKKEDFFDFIRKEVAIDLEPLGFNISRIFLIGSFDVPETVMKALNLKIEATQRAQQRENELREAEAEAKKQIAIAEGQAKSQLIKAQAESASNQLISKSVTAELVQWQSVQKWDGKLPSTLASHGVPFILPTK